MGTTAASVLLLTLCALFCGGTVACAYMLGGKYTKSFSIALLLLPAVVAVVILLVNGELGAGLAVAGTFSLVRFRSVQGTARDIALIFFAMATGLCCGMGYIWFAMLFGVVISGIYVLLCKTPFAEGGVQERELRILIPEDLDYTEIFDDLFRTYTTHTELNRVKTTNLGTMFELTYQVRLRDSKQEKALIDAIRCRNGNLTVSASRASTLQETL